MNNIKTGWKTTEFCLTVVSNIIGGLNMIGAIPGVPSNVKGTAAIAGSILSAVATAAYAISRAIAKRPVSPSVNVPTAVINP